MTSQEYLLLNNIAHQMRKDLVLRAYVHNIKSAPNQLSRERYTRGLMDHIGSAYPMFFLIISKYK